MERKINVTIYNEYVHELSDPEITKIYPEGIHGAIAKMLGRDDRFNIRCATLQMPECGLSDDVLASTEVLFWWGHCAHDRIPDELARKVADRVLGGMGLVVLHSGHLSKPFKLLMGTCCRSKWRENDEKERLWVIEPAHPIAAGLPEYIELEKEETYGERFEIPTPDELIFISWFSGGEVFRSGCCYKRGLGKIFYFRPGHEAYPTFYREDISRVLHNAALWAAPSGGPHPTLGHFAALEKVHDKFDGMDDNLRLHTYIQNEGVKSDE